MKEPEMVRIAGGMFSMGSNSKEAFPDERPVHEVTVSDFWIGKYQVTQGEWNSVMPINPSHREYHNLPVTNVSWDEAKEYIHKLNEKTNRKYRLPTEAEWEYACRAGGKEDRYSENLDPIAWYDKNSRRKTHEVGQKRGNVFGLHDMLGNVWEWVEDHYGVEYYEREDSQNPKGPLTGACRVIRGGSWFGGARHARAASRFYCVPSFRFFDLGFRLARDF